MYTRAPLLLVVPEGALGECTKPQQLPETAARSSEGPLDRKSDFWWDPLVLRKNPCRNGAQVEHEVVNSVRMVIQSIYYVPKVRAVAILAPLELVWVSILGDHP